MPWHVQPAYSRRRTHSPASRLVPRFIGAVLALPRVLFADGLEVGPFELGGAARGNVLDKSWETRTRRFPRADLEFDTLRARLDFEQGRWSGSAQTMPGSGPTSARHWPTADRMTTSITD